ncbi:MAG: PAS domain S-box protein [Fibrobacterales bacterium]
MQSLFVLSFAVWVYVARVSIPLWVSVGGASFLFALAAVLRADSISRFVTGKRTHKWSYSIPFVCTLSALYFGFVADVYVGRNLSVTAPLVVLLSYMMMVLLQNAKGSVAWLYRGVAFLTFVKAVMLITRFVYNTKYGYEMDLSQDNIIATLFFILVALEVLEATVFLLLNMQRSELLLSESNKELTESENRFHSLSDASFEGVAIVENEKVIEVNSSFIAMYGFNDASEVVGKEFSEFIPHNKYERVMLRLNSDENSPYESEGLKKDKSIIPVEYNGKPFEYKDSLLRIIAVKDMSRQVAAEKEIKDLKGILPLCSYCNKIKDDEGNWEKVDQYIQHNSQADISHSLCPTCLKQNYPDEYEKMKGLDGI